jgi:hypothetical protein
MHRCTDWATRAPRSLHAGPSRRAQGLAAQAQGGLPADAAGLLECGGRRSHGALRQVRELSNSVWGSSFLGRCANLPARSVAYATSLPAGSSTGRCCKAGTASAPAPASGRASFSGGLPAGCPAASSPSLLACSEQSAWFGFKRPLLPLRPAAGRRDILVSIGGQAYGSVTEDYNTAMHLMSAGFATMYLNERLVFGMVPEDIQGAAAAASTHPKRRSASSRGGPTGPTHGCMLASTLIPPSSSAKSAPPPPPPLP